MILYLSKEKLYRSATLSTISLRCLDGISILLVQNDGLVLSFRFHGRSTSSLFKKSLSDRKLLTSIDYTGFVPIKKKTKLYCPTDNYIHSDSHSPTGRCHQTLGTFGRIESYDHTATISRTGDPLSSENSQRTR